LYFFEQTVYLFSELGVVVTFDNVPWQFSAGYYLLLISIILFLNKKNEKVFNS